MAEQQKATEQQGGMFKDPKKIPFLQHFNELRKRLTQYVIVLFLLSFLFYWQPIHELIMRIIFRDVFPHIPDAQFAIMGIFDAMTFRFTVGVYAALVITIPLLMYHIFAFFAPAMKDRERKWVFPVIGAASGLFVTGVLFAYFLILPTAVQWLVNQHTAFTYEVPRAQEWLSGVILLLLAFGISFELPLVVFALIALGIVTYPAIRESWRVVYVGLFVLAAIVTPDRGPVTMLALAIALLLLYEGGLFIARLVLAKRIDEQYVDAYNEMLIYDNAPTNDREKLARRERMRKHAEAAQKRIDAREEAASASNDTEDAGESDQGSTDSAVEAHTNTASVTATTVDTASADTGKGESH